jgi:hypothetical protein
VILLLDGQCAAHIIHREIESTFKTKELIPNLYATAFACSLPGVYSQVEKRVRELVTSDLEQGFFPGLRPPEEFAEHNRLIGELTILRVRLVRARTELGDEVNPELQELYLEFLCLFNGDITVFRVQHYCIDDCCNGQCIRVTIDRMVAWFMKAIFSRLGSDLPSQTRWYTFSPHLACQGAGMYIHGILSRVVCHVLVPGPINGDDDESSFHVHANKRKAKSVTFCSDVQSASEDLGIALVCTAPLQQLSYRLQHLDYKGGSLVELLNRGQDGILKRTQQMMWEISNSWYDSTRSRQTKAILHHLDRIGADTSRSRRKAREASTGLAAGTWCRLELRYHNWPFLLLSCEDGVEDEFFAANLCCLDSWFSEPVRAKTTNAADLRQVDMKQLRDTLAKECATSTNMMLEGILAEFKAAVKSTRAQNAEKTAFLSHLSQLLKQHFRLGRRDCRGELPRETLLAAGMPFEHETLARRPRPDARWRNYRFAQWKAQNPLAVDADGYRELSAEWTSMTLDERAAAVASRDVPGECPDDADDDTPTDLGMWDCGDTEYPVRPDVVMNFLADHPATSQSAGIAGVARRSRLVRAAERHRLIVHDQGGIANSAKFIHRHSCGERHPGLCAFVDRELYDDALQLALNMERALDDRFKHRFFCATDFSEDSSVVGIANHGLPEQPWFFDSRGFDLSIPALPAFGVFRKL